MKPREEAPYISKIVLQNIAVLAVGKQLDGSAKDAKEAKQVTVATLMVTSEEAERLALAADRGHVLLALRGLGDADHAETRGISPPTLMLTAAPEPPPPASVPIAAPAPRPRPRREAARPEPPAAPAAAEKQVIEVIRGDLYEKRAFDTREKRP
jgi:pilus assembly protein CpaB